jgi:hypothetical protein
MTNPGQQAAQQAAAAASRAASQQAATSSRMGQDAYSSFARNSAYRARRGRRIGFFGVIGRLIGLVITLVIIGVAVSIVLTVLHQHV